MVEEYRTRKSRTGWVTIGTGRWRCDICDEFLSTKTSYDYFKGMCPMCRDKVPAHIPTEQGEKWLEKWKDKYGDTKREV